MQTDWQHSIDPLGNATHQFISDDNGHRKVSGCVWAPELRTQHDVLVTFLHGASGTRFQAPIPYLADLFASQGIISLAIDGPVHGLRQKLDGGRIALYAEMSKPRPFDNLFKDWALALHLVESKFQYSIRTIAYIGLSMGTFFGVPYLAYRSRQGASTTAAVLGLLGLSGVVSPFKKRLLRDAASINCPLLFLLQQDDEMFTRSGSLALYNSLSSPSKILRESPGKHAAVPLSEFDLSFKFVLRHLLE